MFNRQPAVIFAAASALALAFAAPAAAQMDAGLPELPSVTAAAPDLPSFPPPAPGTVPMPPAPAMAWQGASAAPALQLEPRARDAWLGECRRRTTMYYDTGWGHGKRKKRGKQGHDDHMSYRGGYDYCEAYLDDYYRYYAQPGAGYGHAYMVPMRPMQMTMMPAQTREVSQPVEEFVTEEYVPVRTRTVAPRRTIRSKRVRDKRIRVY